MDFLALQTEVRTNIIDLPTAVTNLVPSFINRAMKELQNKHNFKVMETGTGILSTVENTRLLAVVPDNFKEYRGKPIEISAMGGVRELGIAADFQSATLDFGSELGGEAVLATLTGRPEVIFRQEPSSDAGGTSFHVYPLPDGNSLYANGEYRIAIPFWKYVIPLAANESFNWFTNNAEEWLIFQATAHGFFADWDEERAAGWIQRAALKLQEVVALDKRLRVSAVDTLIPHADVLGPRNAGWRQFPR